MIMMLLSIKQQQNLKKAKNCKIKKKDKQFSSLSKHSNNLFCNNLVLNKKHYKKNKLKPQQKR